MGEDTIGGGLLRDACDVLRSEECAREKEEGTMQREQGNRALDGLSQLRTETIHA